jgi:hypothetical protein
MKRLPLLAFSAAMGIWALASIPGGNERSQFRTNVVRIPTGHQHGARGRVSHEEEVAAVPNSRSHYSIFAYSTR